MHLLIVLDFFYDKVLPFVATMSLRIQATKGTGVVPAEGSPMLKPWEVCNLLRVSMWDSGRQLWGCHVSEWRGCPNLAIGRSGTEGVPQVPLRESSEGDLKLSSGGITALPFAQRPTWMKSEGRVDLTGEGTSERFDFRASRAVYSP
ncbi:unnamed protein product [Prunus armeniaca]